MISDDQSTFLHTQHCWTMLANKSIGLTQRMELCKLSINNFRYLSSVNIHKLFPKHKTLSIYSSIRYQHTNVSTNSASHWISLPSNINTGDIYRIDHALITTPACISSPSLLIRNVYKPNSLVSWISVYLELSKAKLSSLVVFTTLLGYSLAPFSNILLISPSLNSMTLLTCTIFGTTLCSFSANAFNQWIEAPFDAQMSRTRNRPIPRHVLSPPHAFTFALLSGLGGFTLLYSTVAALPAFLALGTILLYAGIYTPMKRYSMFNTWIGAIVGSIPPLIGWSAAQSTTALGIVTDALNVHNNHTLTSMLGLGSGAWMLAFILYAWQFPHFCSLSWNLRNDYAKAGYYMASVLAPALNARVSLRYSLCFIPLTFIACYLNITNDSFLIFGNLVNAIMLWPAWKFYKSQNKKTARTLFFGTLMHLSLFLACLFLCRDTLVLSNLLKDIHTL